MINYMMENIYEGHGQVRVGAAGVQKTNEVRPCRNDETPPQEQIPQKDDDAVTCEISEEAKKMCEQ